MCAHGRVCTIVPTTCVAWWHTAWRHVSSSLLLGVDVVYFFFLTTDAADSPIGAHMLIASEGLGAISRSGVDVEKALSAINGSSGRSWVTMQRFPDNILTGKPYGFALGMHCKFWDTQASRCAFLALPAQNRTCKNANRIYKSTCTHSHTHGTHNTHARAPTHTRASTPTPTPALTPIPTPAPTGKDMENAMDLVRADKAAAPMLELARCLMNIGRGEWGDEVDHTETSRFSERANGIKFNKDE